jgi:ribosomal protein RSM22 (predicted rRNA methylase)
MTLAPIHQSLCTTCRLRSLVAAKQYARVRTPTTRDWTRSRQITFTRYLHTSRISLQQPKPTRQEEDLVSSSSIKQSTTPNQTLDKKLQAEELARQAEEDFDLEEIDTTATEDAKALQSIEALNASPEAVARAARQRFGDALPEDLLNDKQYAAYERLYGPPIGNPKDEVVDFEENELEGELDETDNVGTGILKENEDGVLEEVEYIEEEEFEEEEEEQELAEEDVEGVTEGDPEAALDAQTIKDLAALRLSPELLEDSEEYIDAPYDHTRAHPLTVANRFGTPSSTVQLPASSFVDPVTRLVSGVPNKHISEVAHRIFGGVGLPYSTSTPQLALNLPQKAIPLNPSQGRMSDMDADIFTTTLMPGIYASVFSVLVETRKRLGSSWLEGLLTREGGPRILDAGGAGVGVMAARDVLQAEWERMHDTSGDEDSFMAIAEAGGKTGGESIPAPVGKATVLTSNEALRYRASKLLDNTTFLPRLPDYMHATDESARERGKYDIIIAPHTLWPLKEDHIRKQYVKNLWSLLSTDGGVLVLLEKGVPRGFELVAAARELLLNSRISSPGNEAMSEDVEEPGEGTVWGKQPKDKGMIVAPCTNHLGCPMYVNRGISKGRKDFCHFKQRYIRPPFLQKILGAKHRNHEDVEFSYVSVMRGRDLRDKNEENIIQGEVATDRAFIGFENPQAMTEEIEDEFDPTAPAVPDMEDTSTSETPHSLSLPRMVLPPLKRQGHVIIDMCTPAGTLERWTVPKSFSKQAYRDARKASWGDIWALGAKSRTPKNVRVGRGKEELGGVEKKKRASKAKNTVEVGYDSAGNIKEEDIKVKTGGRMRQGKIKGIRDKRDKKADGRGRRKNLDKE